MILPIGIRPPLNGKEKGIMADIVDTQSKALRVDSSSVKSVSLHVPLAWQLRLYALPFGIVWLAFGVFYLVNTEGLAEDVVLICCLLVGLLHALAFLVCQWSVNIRTLFTCLNASDPYKAKLIKVIPAEHCGAPELCEIHRNEETRDVKGRAQLFFVFQQRKFFYNPDTNIFHRLDYPVRESYDYYQKSIGFTSSEQIANALKKWGQNSFVIPVPTFLDLYKEHAVAPFFVFQVFCVGLWCLDEYWYFSLFTLSLLLVFESTVVYQRVRSVNELRKMAPKPYPISVYRCGSWSTVMTNNLLPGDICSIVRSQDDRAVPCDVLLLSGSCIVNEAMLTGESTPQIKEPISDCDGSEILDVVNRDKLHILFGGTRVVQSAASKDHVSNIGAPSDGGAVGFVLRTGFDTSQGKLVRTILFSTERVTANNLESLFFILFLMIFAIAASTYVWIKGMESGRTRWKVVLDCVLIVTSVIPPELPMELALAVNQSIIALSQLAIFCTEPFRIPFAGKVDICCFDKTGTLTTEELIVEGVAALDPNDDEALFKTDKVPETTAFVLGVCHALMQTDEGLIGDPMEKAALDAIDWTFSKSNVASSKKGRNKSLKLLRRFPFSSALKRMSTVASFEAASDDRLFVAVKGAPETLASMLSSVPPSYERIHKQFAIQGARVLALGYKYMPMLPSKEIKELSREKVESELIFAGFLILSCPLKPDSREALEMLYKSSHRLIMITGDNALTACHVAREVHIVQRSVLIMDARQGIEHPHTIQELQWSSLDDSNHRVVENDIKALQNTFYDNDVCLTGRALSTLSTVFRADLGRLLAHVRVFARTSPQEKELVLTSLKESGYITLMCGDGTNDVGALKQAHVGVALLDGKPEDLPKILHQMRTQATERRKKALEEAQKRQNASLIQQQQQVTGRRGQAGGAVVRPPDSIAEATRRRQELMSSMQKIMVEMEENEVPLVKLGDASIAAPFTSKISYVTSICNIIRQGRSTLVTTMQMYKILALNCLVTAYSLSVLYQDGIKYGDMQMTIQGMLLAICFLGLSNAKPLKALSKKRPQPNIFNLYILLSVIGQFAVHIFSLISVTAMAKSFMEEDPTAKVDLEKHFEPSLLNGAIYLLSLSMQVSTFAINYQGHPFRESIFENKPLLYSLSVVMVICLVAASDVSSDMREWLVLVPFPIDYRNALLGWIAFDFAGAYAVEALTSFLFSDNRPHSSLRLN